MFEPRRLNKKASKALETDGRFQTETSSLGKLGRGLTSQVTGLGKNLFGSKSTRGSSELVPPDSQKATVVNELDAAPAKRELPTRRPMRPAEGTSSTVSATPSTVNSTSTTNVAAAKPDNVVTNVDDYKPSKPINGTASVESIPAIPDTTPTTGLAIDKKSSRLSLASISDKASVYSQQSRIEDGEGYLIRILGAKDLKPVDSGGTSDPYVKVSVSGSDKKSMYKTAAQKKTLNPVWEKEWFMVSAATTLKFSIVDKNVISSNVPLGHVLLPIATVFGENDKFDDWFKIQEGTGSLHLAGEIGKRNALEGKKTLFKRSRDFSVS
jgi:hypothetical protein